MSLCYDKSNVFGYSVINLFKFTSIIQYYLLSIVMTTLLQEINES